MVKVVMLKKVRVVGGDNRGDVAYVKMVRLVRGGGGVLMVMVEVVIVDEDDIEGDIMVMLQ